MTSNRKCSELLQTGKMYCSSHKERTKSLSCIHVCYFLMLHGASQVTAVFFFVVVVVRKSVVYNDYYTA